MIILGKMETNNNCLTRFTTRLQNIEIPGGEQIMCSPQFLGKYLTSATLGEITVETECFKEICFIQWADENLYGELLEKF